MYIEVKVDVAISKHYTHVLNIYYHGLHIIDEYDQQYDHEYFYCKQIDSVFYLSKDSTYFNLRKSKGYFQDDSNLKITDVSFMSFRPTTANLLMESCDYKQINFVENEISDRPDNTEMDEDPVNLSYVENCEIPPSFPGGQDSLNLFLKTNMVYPLIAKENGADGTTYVQFIVEIDGSISDVVILKGVEFHLNKEAIRLVKSMPKWIPGSYFNKGLVRCRVILPVRFSLM